MLISLSQRTHKSATESPATPAPAAPTNPRSGSEPNASRPPGSNDACTRGAKAKVLRAAAAAPNPTAAREQTRLCFESSEPATRISDDWPDGPAGDGDTAFPFNETILCTTSIDTSLIRETVVDPTYAATLAAIVSTFARISSFHPGASECTHISGPTKYHLQPHLYINQKQQKLDVARWIYSLLGATCRIRYASNVSLATPPHASNHGVQCQYWSRPSRGAAKRCKISKSNSFFGGQKDASPASQFCT